MNILLTHILKFVNSKSQLFLYSQSFQYLVHYLKSLMDWLDPSVVETVPVATTAWALLRDSYHGNLCLRYKPDVMAVSVLYLTLQSYGVEVPCSEEAEDRWWEVMLFCKTSHSLLKNTQYWVSTFRLQWKINFEIYSLAGPVGSHPCGCKFESTAWEHVGLTDILS